LACIVTTAIGTGMCPDVTNTTCLCTNAELNAKIEICVAQNCTIREQLQTKKYSVDTCHAPAEDRTALVWIVGIVFGILGIVAFSLRCFARLFVGVQSWGLDDWVMCLAVVGLMLAPIDAETMMKEIPASLPKGSVANRSRRLQGTMIPLAAMSVPLSQSGLGLDMWNVSFDNITKVLYYYYFDELLYITSLSLTKVSILCFYLKVFPARYFRWCVFVLIGLNLAYAIGFDLALIFQCHPLEGAWLQWDGTYKDQCTSINVLGWSAAAFNIALDMATIILPLPELYRLSMSIKKKVQIMAMFTVGFFVTIVSIIRLRSLIEFGTTQNLTRKFCPSSTLNPRVHC